MDFQKLEYFLAIAQEGNLTKAAKSLYMSQPPLSYQLKSLEQELGIQLFEKRGRNLTLTEPGRILYERGSVILELFAQTLSELEYAVDSSQVLSIGNASAWFHNIFPSQINDLKKDYPNIKFSFSQGDSHDIIHLLNKGSIEIGFVTLPSNPKKYESRLLNIDPVVAISNINQPFGSNHDSITLKELASCPGIIVHKYAENTVRSYYQKVGINANLLCSTNNEHILDWVIDSPWVALTSKSAYESMPHKNITSKIIVAPSLEITSFIIWKKDQILSSSAQNFIDSVLKKFPPFYKPHNVEISKIIRTTYPKNKRL